MTYLELVNAVLLRLREPEVSDVSGSTYIKLIAHLVNNAKRAVEDAAEWVVLENTASIVTSAGTDTYTLTGTNERTTIFNIVDTANKYTLERRQSRDLILESQLNTEMARPTDWAISGISSGELQVLLYHNPDDAYAYTVNCCIPQADFTANTDSLYVPSEPVIMHAYAYALKERGEDQGQSFMEAYDAYRRCLSRYKILNGHTRNSGGGLWRVL